MPYPQYKAHYYLETLSPVALQTTNTDNDKLL